MFSNEMNLRWAVPTADAATSIPFDRRQRPVLLILMDILDRQARSRLMGRIRGKDTKPEMAVRRLAHCLGFRLRPHRRDLPGSPDLVFPARRKVVFVHGCYWRRHPCCRLAYEPKSNVEFWTEKFAGGHGVRVAENPRGEMRRFGRFQSL